MSTTNVVSIDSGCHRARVFERRDELALTHLTLVDALARKVHLRLPPSFDLADLVGVGLLALLDAALRYQPAVHGGAPFSAYARKGIRGAMLESVRRRRYVENTRPGLAVISDRAAAPPVTEEALDAARLRRRVAEAIACLPAPQRALLEHYYGTGEPTIGQVAKSLGLSRAAAVELHDRAIAGVRARLTGGAVERITA